MVPLPPVALSNLSHGILKVLPLLLQVGHCGHFLASPYLDTPLYMLIAHLTYTDQNRVPCDGPSMVAPLLWTRFRAYMQTTAMIASIRAVETFGLRRTAERMDQRRKRLRYVRTYVRTTGERTNERTTERTNVRTNVRMNVRTYRQTGGRPDGQTDGRTD